MREWASVGQMIRTKDRSQQVMAVGQKGGNGKSLQALSVFIWYMEVIIFKELVQELYLILRL